MNLIVIDTGMGILFKNSGGRVILDFPFWKTIRLDLEEEILTP